MNLQYLLTPSKVLPFYLERKESNAHELAPVSVEFHPTSACNYRCFHCSYGNRNTTPHKLEKSVLESALRDLTESCKPRSAYISGGGEPTTYAQWKQIIATCNTAGIETALITNGASLGEEDVAFLAMLNYIAVSVYSTDENQYKSITGGKNFSKQFAVPDLLRGHDVIKGARCVISKMNIQNIQNIYGKAIDSGFDYIIFIPAIDYEGRGIGFGEEEKKNFLRMMESHAAEFDEKKTNIQKIATNAASYYRKTHKITSPVCHGIQLRTNAFINYDGGVYLCQPHIGTEEYCIGNINNNRFKDIWNGNRHEAIIEKLQEQWVRKKCVNCRNISYNNCIADYEATAANTPIEVVRDPFL